MAKKENQTSTKNWVIINPKHVISIISAPAGVKHKKAGTSIGHVDSTIIETETWTYVIKNFSYKSNFKETLKFKVSNILHSVRTSESDLAPIVQSNPEK